LCHCHGLPRIAVGIVSQDAKIDGKLAAASAGSMPRFL
jgi:hypothetical protein